MNFLAKTRTVFNRKASYLFELGEEYVTGIVLQRAEIKSIRLGRVSLQGSYCYFVREELFIKGIYIASYVNDGVKTDNNSTIIRKLLLKKKELKKLEKIIRERGYTLVPTTLFINKKGWAKIKISVAIGKKKHDKRANIKKRDIERKIREG